MKLVACKSAPGFLDANIDRMLDLKEERRATLFSWAGRRLPSRQMFEAWDAVAEAACAVIIMKRLACHEKMNDLLQTSRDVGVVGWASIYCPSLSQPHCCVSGVTCRPDQVLQRINHPPLRVYYERTS
ncbi:uncharacterized protein [Scyliorhinus torazame]|uniref:uncharacterized protein isoform X1 n=1 Tax=Scyliorhinus torazame TaxID=75743 RepID=UPI003B59F11A